MKRSVCPNTINHGHEKTKRASRGDDAARARVDSAFVQRATPTKVRFDDDDDDDTMTTR